MTVTETKQEGLKKELKIVVPSKEMEDKIAKRFERLSAEIKVPGFRPGHVPVAYLEKKYGKAVRDETVEDALQEYTQKAFDDEKIQPVMRPKITVVSFEDGKDLEYSVEVEVFPDIKIVDFNDLELEKLVAEVTDEEVQKALDRLAASRRETQELKEARPSKLTDTVVIDFKGSVDGVEFQGGEGKDYSLELGSHTFIEGFEDQLVGKNKGDKVKVNVTFPENYHVKDLAGKPAVFDVEIKDIREPKPIEVNDEFAKLFGKSTLADLKEMIKDELTKEYENVSKGHLKRALLDLLSAMHHFEVPKGMLDMEFDTIWHGYEEAKKNGRLDDEEKNKTEEEMKAEYQALADRRVRLGLLLADIAQKNNITVTQDDLTKAVIEESRRFPGQEKMVYEYYFKNPQVLENMKAPIFEAKVVDFILSKISLKDKKVSVQELYAWEPEVPELEEKAPKKAKKEKK